jgi:hypothetical protein
VSLESHHLKLSRNDLSVDPALNAAWLLTY